MESQSDLDAWVADPPAHMSEGDASRLGCGSGTGVRGTLLQRSVGEGSLQVTWRREGLGKLRKGWDADESRRFQRPSLSSACMKAVLLPLFGDPGRGVCACPLGTWKEGGHMPPRPQEREEDTGASLSLEPGRKAASSR